MLALAVGTGSALAQPAAKPVKPVKPAKPTKPAKGPKGKPAKVTICHRTGDPAKPFVQIVVSEKALPAHLAHGDVAHGIDGSCPAGAATPTEGEEAAPTDEPTTGEAPEEDTVEPTSWR